MSVTKQDLHAEQKAHAVTRSLLDVARIDVMRLRSEVEALRGELGGRVDSGDVNAEIDARDAVIKEANRRLTAIGAKPVTGALR